MLLFYGEMFTLVKHTVHSVCVDIRAFTALDKGVFIMDF